MIYNNVSEVIGGTPLIMLQNVARAHKLKAMIAVKYEGKNPAGSIKDRAALYMINDAERRGLLCPGGTIIEATSGNTGIGLAAIGAVRGYTVILTMPESMSVERRTLLRGYGAKLVLTPAKDGMSGAVKKAEEIHQNTPGSIIAGQFVNKANVTAHYETTGPEIWDDTDGRVAAFTAGIGCGGTVSGVGKYLKEKNRDIKIYGVEPSASPLISEGRAGAHGIMGIGADFIPEIVDMSVIDGMITVSEDEAYAAARELATSEGILCGISSGANLFAAMKLAEKDEFEGKLIVTVLPDTGDKYLSTPLFE